MITAANLAVFASQIAVFSDELAAACAFEPWTEARISAEILKARVLRKPYADFGWPGKWPKPWGRIILSDGSFSMLNGDEAGGRYTDLKGLLAHLNKHQLPTGDLG